MFVRRTGQPRPQGAFFPGFGGGAENMIMAYFERKGCVQRNLYLNCVSL